MLTYLLSICEKVIKVYKTILFGHVVEIPSVIGTRPAIDELTGVLVDIISKAAALKVNLKPAAALTVEMTANGNAIIRVQGWGYVVNVLRSTTPVTGDAMRWMIHVPARVFPLSEIKTMRAALDKALNVMAEIR